MNGRNEDKGEEKQYIPQDIENAFRKTLKQGIYKELHQKKLLSDEQLNALVKNT